MPAVDRPSDLDAAWRSRRSPSRSSARAFLPIPPTDWGAIENVLWCLKQELERRGHLVHIYNTHLIHQVVDDLNRARYDFIHLHNELFASFFSRHLRVPYALTTQFGGLYRFTPENGRYASFAPLFADSLHAQANIVLTDGIRELYTRAGYRGVLRVLRNGVETERFRFTPHGNGRSICVGRIIPRKRQRLLAETVQVSSTPVDFVGPWDRRLEPEFKPGGAARYLGVWTRQDLYERLTDYSCLVLLSESECAPLVVLEALAAGLSLVVSEACAPHLTPEEFITVIPDNELRPETINTAIAAAVERNASCRPRIREYARSRFDYAKVADDYLAIARDCRDCFAQAVAC